MALENDRSNWLGGIGEAFAGGTRKTGTMSIIQLSVEENQRGRVMGTMFMFSQIAAGIGAYLIGTVAVGYGLKPPVVIGVMIGVIFWIGIYVRHKNLRQIS